MNIIITAGGTEEKIDEVRKIINVSSGKLGCQIVNSFVQNDFFFNENIENIFYITTKNSLNPVKYIIDRLYIDYKEYDQIFISKLLKKIQVIYIIDTLSLRTKIKEIIEENKIDFFIHSMAVSDYRVEKLLNIDNFIDNLTKEIKTIDMLQADNTFIKNLIQKEFENCEKIDNSSKVSSNMEKMYIQLTKNPKIVDEIKLLDPDIHLISFKLLNNVSEEELIKVAIKQLERTNSEVVLANDLTSIKNGKHTGFFIEKDKNLDIKKTKIQGKKDIANFIVQYIMKKKFTQSFHQVNFNEQKTKTLMKQLKELTDLSLLDIKKVIINSGMSFSHCIYYILHTDFSFLKTDYQDSQKLINLRKKYLKSFK